MKYLWAVPGQRVVCILDFSAWWCSPSHVLPIEGVIYTIREVTEPCEKCSNGAPLLRFEELQNPKFSVCGRCGDVVECRMPAFHFRPVYKTNIDVFEKLLAPTPKTRVKEDA